MRRTILLALLALLATPAATALHASPSPADEVEVLDGGRAGVSWRAVAFAPDGTHALIAGTWTDGERARDVVARWDPTGGLTEVLNRSGSGLTDVAFHPSGTSLVVGIRNTLLLGTPGAYENVWNESDFAEGPDPLTFYGLRAAFRPGQDTALVAGSSLLRMDLDGELTVVHGGRGAFFRSLAWNPSAPFALVEAAVEREGRALLGAVWRTNGSPPLDQDDNVAIYGRFTPGSALLNTIAFAPNGSFALLGGRDGAGASLLSWSSHRAECHRHEGACHDHRWQYLPTAKPEGPITCVAWHPSGRYALVTGLDRDVVGYAGTRLWAPLLHQGPDLFGCAFHPSGGYALAVGDDGALLRIVPGEGPVGAVVTPDAGALVAPEKDASFLVGVLERSASPGAQVDGAVAGANASVNTSEQAPWWRLDVDARSLKDGTHRLVVNVTTDVGTARFGHTFLVNNERFTPERPRILEPEGLEGTGADADGRFQVRWELVDAPVVYEVQERTVAGTSNVTRTYQAGSSNNVTIKVNEDGSYLYRVRAKNAFNASAWSEGVVVNVILDSDGDGVPDSKDPRPFLHDEWSDTDGDGVNDDVEYLQCSDPTNAASTPASDDDGDGIPNGLECRQGTDPLDPLDPANGEDGGDGGDGGDGEPADAPSPHVIAVITVVAMLAIFRRNGARR